MPAMLGKAVVAASWAMAASQQAGTLTPEAGPKLTVQECTVNDGCVDTAVTAVLDANWRWIHNTDGYKDCFKDQKWDASFCPDPETCAQRCALEGVDAEKYQTTYGVSAVPGGLQLNFLTGSNVGSRVYLRVEDSYKMFQLKNREFTMDVDVSQLPCGMNGAVYFVEMDANGGGGEKNKAGAKYGTGYCDAQCPHDVKFIEGSANVVNWNDASATGGYGSCCAEMDIWEANSRATAYTPHPCALNGPLKCMGIECGDGSDRYKGVCDKDGCDYNSYRMGEANFYGPGPQYSIDTTRPFSLVTQFITSDGTDTGDLVDIKRYYWQDGVGVVANSPASIFGESASNSLTDKFCQDQKALFKDLDDFTAKGGVKQMGEALGRGMVLVLSLWDDGAVNMLWLDSTSPVGSTEPGAARGPCPGGESSTPAYLRANFPNAYVRYTNIAVGEIGSTIALRRRLSNSTWV